MKPKVYIETSVVSYLVSRPSRNLVLAAYQQITGEWWELQRPKYRCFVSDFVVEELSRGDRDAAKRRLDAVASFLRLPVSDEASELAKLYLRELNIPRKASLDAFHIALAVVHEMDYILSWNFRHIANAVVRHKLGTINTRLGIVTPEICTPEELVDGVSS